jgi:hypothetical protein
MARKGWFVAIAVGTLAFGAVMVASRPTRSVSADATVYTYTGTVDSVCGHARGAPPPCFALSPDPGTARDDGYYAGRGDVSFGPPPSDGFIPDVGQHVTVTVTSVIDRGTAVVEVSPDSA